MKYRTSILSALVASAAVLCAPVTATAQSILKTAGNFALLGGTDVTSDGTAGTVITNGNVGSATSVIGYADLNGGAGPAVITSPAVMITGTAVVGTALTQLGAAQVGLAGIASTATMSGVDLGGLTLFPGVYTFGGAASQNGNLVLDAQGKNNVFWVFQIGTTLTTAAGAHVTLINPGTNGGSDCGIFWNAGAGINFGDNNIILGNYLAGTTISFTIGTNGTGGSRALSNAGVTLIQDQINVLGGPGITGSDWTGGLKFSGAAVVPTAVAPVIGTQPASQSKIVGDTVTFNVVHTGFPATFTYTWKKGLTTLTNAGNISGATTDTLTLTGAALADAGSYTVTVDNGVVGAPTTSSAAVLTMNLALATTQAVATKALTAGTAAVAFTPVTVTGGTGTVTFAITGTALPAGLSLNTSTGQITQVSPSAATASAIYTITATDTAAPPVSSSKTFTLVVNAAPSSIQAIATTTLTAGTAAVSFTPVTAANGTSPLAFAVSPALPTGLAFNTGTGAITGTPIVVTTATTYTVTVTDALLATTSKTFSLTVNAATVNTPPPILPIITGAITAPGTVGTAFGPYQIAATGSPTSFAASGLPAGLTVNTVTGIISGTPTTAGVVVVPISATGSTGTGTANLTITVSAVGGAPIITSATTTSGAIGTAIATYQIVATGSPTSFAATGLPAGLTINVLTGAINGTPTTAGLSAATISATNGAGTGSAALTIAVVATSTPPSIASASTASGTVGTPFVTYQIMATGNPTSYGAGNLPPGLVVNSVTGRITGTPLSTGNYHVSLSATTATGVATTGVIFTIAPSFTVQPVANTSVASGTGATFSVAANTGGNNVTYQWQKDGVNLPGATSATLTVGNVQSGNVGYYTVVVSSWGTSTTSVPAQLGMTFTGQISGGATLVGAAIVHPNGNVYDQVLLTGPSASVKANAGNIVRVSFVDLTDDIVQVELGGAGVLTVNLENSSGPAAPVNYNQPGVLYMRGHAVIAISGADATTNVSVFSVGTSNAVDQTLFRTGVKYDGWADISLLSIASVNGNFGGVRTANASYFRTSGMTGIYAPGVLFSGPVFAGDIDGANSANAVLILGSAADVRITGGDLFQDNGGTVEVSGMTRLQFTSGTSSSGALLPAQANRGVLMTNGVNVTSQFVGQIQAPASL